PALAMTLDAASFLGAALLLRSLPPLLPDREAAPTGPVLARLPADLREALAHAWARPDLFRAVLAKAPVAVAAGGGFILLNVVATDRAPFRSAALSLGLLQAVRGAGTGLGPMLAAAWVKRGRSSDAVGKLAVVLTLGAIAVFALGPPAV